MSYDADEKSAEDSRPIELITIVVNDGITTYRHTSANRDQVYGGQTFTALSVDRGPVELANIEEDKETEIRLPIDHPLARRWPVQAAPPWKAEVTITRLQQRSGEAQIIWQGEIDGVSFDKGVAAFRVPSQAGLWALRPIPSFSVSDSCVHVLGDDSCRVNLAGNGPTGIAHRLTCTVLAIDGRDVRVDLVSLERNGSWALDGTLRHPASGEPRSIVGQTDIAAGVNAITTLRMSLVIPGLAVGHSVVVTAGCPKTMPVCVGRFDNRQNQLAWHLKPYGDLFSPVLGGAKR